jgi:hypothetical protein
MNQLHKRLERPDLMAKQITKLYMSATDSEALEGLGWYVQAHEICKLIGQKYHCPLPKVVGVMAALSPATNWQQNVADAHNLIMAWSHGLSPDEVVCTTYGPNKAKAVRILNLDKTDKHLIARELLHKSKINKTASFFYNILEPENDYLVTIDRHAFRIALGNSSEADNICMTEKRYRNLMEAYHIAAKGLDVSAIQLQAIVWCAFRRQAGIAAANIENDIFQSIVSQI